MNNDNEEGHSRTTIATLVLICMIVLLGSNSIQAQVTTLDSAQITRLYEQVESSSSCGLGMGAGGFLSLLFSYSLPEGEYDYRASNSPSGFNTHTHSHSHSSDTIQLAGTDRYSERIDTVVIKQIDTIVETEIRVDTFFAPQSQVIVPEEKDILTAENILQAILKDDDLTARLQEVVQDMNAGEVEQFRQELMSTTQDMNQLLKEEKKDKILLERAAAKSARQQRKADWKTLPPEEKKEIIKDEIAAIAATTAEGAAATGAAVGGAAVASVGAVGYIIAKGAIAIGKGIVQTATDVWNWIDSRFHIRIDLSCADQRRIKKRRQYVAVLHKTKPLKYYRGNCPNLATK